MTVPFASLCKTTSGHLPQRQQSLQRHFRPARQHLRPMDRNRDWKPHGRLTSRAPTRQERLTSTFSFPVLLSVSDMRPRMPIKGAGVWPQIGRRFALRLLLRAKMLLRRVKRRDDQGRLKPLVSRLAPVVDAERARLGAVGQRLQKIGQLRVPVRFHQPSLGCSADDGRTLTDESDRIIKPPRGITNLGQRSRSPARKQYGSVA